MKSKNKFFLIIVIFLIILIVHFSWELIISMVTYKDYFEDYFEDSKQTISYESRKFEIGII
ncbi:MAG: hypothetical protein LBH32_00345 [Dysgonamonadaceae bacterium]|jgi:membrane-anchored glycerophosphoryl diester phosphodiesterase (GDPDase)|nr:hypothetical protein [Dysgonamonadaceae bacterium]